MNYKELEEAYLQNTTKQHRESFAQFFTPIHISNIMSNWIIKERVETKKILDPAFGLGIFYNFISDKKIEYKAYEIDTKIITHYLHNNKLRANLEIVNQNYLDVSNEDLYDGIICNPPYLKFHSYNNKKYVEKINSTFNLNLAKTSNIYTLFIIKSLSQLSYGGRMAYIVPSEFLNSDYGIEVKKHLLDSGKLRHIAIFSNKLELFNNATTTSCILFFSNDDFNHSQCSFSVLNDLDELNNLETFNAEYPSHEMFLFKYKQSDINPNIKWSKYYNKTENSRYKNLVPFSKYGKVTRGIATGANDYFIFNKSKMALNQINESSLSPCICRVKDVTSVFFTDKTFDYLVNSDKPAYIFNAQKTNEFEETTARYISIGVKQGINKRYLTSNRNPWYSIEKRLPAPIWVNVFNRSGLRFIRNESNVLNLTNFHCVYSKYNDIDLFFAYLISDVAKSIFDENKRTYGNGLNKFEPNDLNKSYMLDIDLLPSKTKSNILRLFNKYKEEIIENGIQKLSYLKKINKLFKDNFLI